MYTYILYAFTVLVQVYKAQEEPLNLEDEERLINDHRECEEEYKDTHKNNDGDNWDFNDYSNLENHFDEEDNYKENQKYDNHKNNTWLNQDQWQHNYYTQHHQQYHGNNHWLNIKSTKHDNYKLDQWLNILKNHQNSTIKDNQQKNWLTNNNYFGKITRHDNSINQEINQYQQNWTKHHNQTHIRQLQDHNQTYIRQLQDHNTSQQIKMLLEKERMKQSDQDVRLHVQEQKEFEEKLILEELLRAEAEKRFMDDSLVRIFTNHSLEETWETFWSIVKETVWETSFNFINRIESVFEQIIQKEAFVAEHESWRNFVNEHVHEEEWTTIHHYQSQHTRIEETFEYFENEGVLQGMNFFGFLAIEAGKAGFEGPIGRAFGLEKTKCNQNESRENFFREQSFRETLEIILHRDHQFASTISHFGPFEWDHKPYIYKNGQVIPIQLNGRIKKIIRSRPRRLQRNVMRMITERLSCPFIKLYQQRLGRWLRIGRESGRPRPLFPQKQQKQYRPWRSTWQRQHRNFQENIVPVITLSDQ